MLQPVLRKNDKQAKKIIGIFSFVVFAAVMALGRIQVTAHLPFDIHILASMNAVINGAIALLLVWALIMVRRKKFAVHKKIMLIALQLSVLFLLSYILHKLFAGEALYGDANLDGLLSAEEATLVSGTRTVYLVILFSHIFLAAAVLPFILFTAYRGLTGDYPSHKKIARYTWPVWFYVAVTGPVVYWFIYPYYR